MRPLRQCLAIGFIASIIPPLLVSSVWAATSKGVGLVTTIQGRASIAHETPPTTPQPLKFRDDVFLRDIINTEAESLARILLRGSNLLTIRELSRVTIAEEALPTGPKSVVSLLAGKLRATVSRALLGAGEQTEIRTPDAVASIRGTDVIILRDKDTTTVGVLEGSAEVTNVPPPRAEREEGISRLVNLFRRNEPEPPILLAQAGPGGPLPVMTAQAPTAGTVLVSAGQFTQIIAGALPSSPATITPALMGVLVGGLQGSGRGHGSQGPGSGATGQQQNLAARLVSPPTTGPGSMAPQALVGPSTAGGTPISTATTSSQVVSTTTTPLVTQDLTITGTFDQKASAVFSQVCSICSVSGTISNGTRTGVRPGGFTGTFSSTNTYTSTMSSLTNEPATITSSGKVSGLQGGNLTGPITINFKLDGSGEVLTHTGNATIKPDGTLNATYSGDIKDSSGNKIGTTSNGKMDQTPK
jgi:hypothetical protein